MLSGTRHSRVAGFTLVAIGVAWLCYVQITLSMVPTALASEAPDRHLPAGDTFSRKDAYELSFALAQEIRGRVPNILLPLVPILSGVWLLSRSRSTYLAERADVTKTI